MDHDAELLTFIHQNARMGVETTAHLAELVADGPFKEELLEQHRSYRDIAGRAEALSPQPLKDIPAPAKAMSDLMINLKTLGDKSSSHIAQMMVKGSTNGIVEITKRIRQYEGTTGKEEQLAQELLSLEEKHMENLKGFIC
jgi:hypothetical protein